MAQRDRALKDLQEMVERSADLAPELKEQITEQVKVARQKPPPLETDKWIYRIVVLVLGLSILSCLGFTFYISLKNTDPKIAIDMPEIFLAIGSAAVGALAGLLAPSPSRGDSE